MWHLKLVPDETSIPFLRIRHMAIAGSLILMVASVVLFFTRGLNLGIDFVGGILIEAGADQPIDIGTIRKTISVLNLGDVAVQEYGSPNDVLIRVERQEGDPEAGISDADAQQNAVRNVQDALSAVIPGLSYRRVETVGPKVSGELAVDGTLSVMFALIAVLIYIWFRFEWQFGLGAVGALFHDVILTIGFFSVTQLEFNLSIVAAILTIVGYSLNDTVVVYDRVREMLRKFRSMKLEELLNLSINRTLSRTLMTSGTTLMALFALFFFGGSVIRPFTAAMIWGIFVGTYSSIFIAAPVLIGLKLERKGFEAAEAKS